ncbi:hypothetical protein BN59_01771 [Legionella massiliensis]|uniref:Uncharacterized protein n=1 Tax=Legionella massiliensis TaxID=1034943 RepID=A0A078L0G4_9GAMM|nr:hypothetical protein [Legionella massiliensis]CDZ77488.1 hypothetical protein BN59_01771 [Legionella massiliensis]CEE13226.1 hypothetical protein BN1094_01771 [Legionella massiliensis]
MSTRRRFEDFETGVEENIVAQEGVTELNLNIKLERRRRIEELFEERRMRAELDEFDLA